MYKFKKVGTIVAVLILSSIFFFACTKKAKLTSLVITTSNASGPTISNVSAGTPTSNSATITWTTNEASTSQVFYGTTKNFGAYTTESQVMTTSHSVTITSLSAATTYYYYVKSKNSSNNSSTKGDDGSLSFVTAVASQPSTDVMYLYFDDVKIEGTGGTVKYIYTDDLQPTIFTGSKNGWNIAYMSADQPSDEAGWKKIFPAMDFYYPDDKQEGSFSWRITFDYNQKAWAGQYVLSSGYWRAEWDGTQKAVDLSGPTGTVKLKCYMKVSGVTRARVSFGMGDDSGSKDSLTNGKVASPTKVMATNTWQQFEVDLTGQNLSSINGVFFWSIAKTDVTK